MTAFDHPGKIDPPFRISVRAWAHASHVDGETVAGSAPVFFPDSHAAMESY